MLAITSILLYSRAFPYPLVEFDDYVYLRNDPRLVDLSLAKIGQILTEPFFGNYHPVTTLTYAADKALWGDTLLGFRLTHVALYAAGVVLLFYLFRELLESPLWAALAAALFATHAVHVEVVAWLAQRKDIVCLTFYVSAILTYVHYTRGDKPRWWLYGASVLLAGMACLSKGYAVVLPAVLLAYDFCFARRMGRRQLLDKLPYLVIGLLVTVLTVAAQDQAHAQVEVPFSLGERITLLFKVFAVYVGKSILPVRLSAMIMVSPSWLHSSVAAIGFLLAVTAVVGFVVLRRRVPAAAFGIALFVLPLATVMNVFFTLRVWIAERYLFLPTIGYSLLIIAFASRWVETHTEESRRGRQYVALVALLVLVVANSVLAIDRVGVWQSPVHLWSDAVRKDAGFSGSGPITADEIGDRAVNEKLLALVAAAYRRQGNIEEAVRLLARVSDAEGIELTLANAAFERSDFDEAVQLAHRVAVRGDWSAPQAWELCGRARKMQNQIDKARICFTRAITAFEKNHRSPLRAQLELALLELTAGRAQEALQWSERARENASTDDPRPLFLLAKARDAAGAPAAAWELCQTLAGAQGRVPEQITFDFGEAHVFCALVAEKLGKNEAAFDLLDKGLTLTEEPKKKSELQVKMGTLAEQLGKNERALALFEAVLRTSPDHAQKANIHVRLGEIASKLDRPRDAIEHLEAVLTAAPNHPERASIRLKIGQLAEQLGDARKALASYREGLRLAPDHPSGRAVRVRINRLSATKVAP
jgi:tetratricopeptide (TPR) repeat protein